MAYPYEVPQPPKRRTWRTVVIVVGAVLVLCCGAAGVGGYFLFKGVAGATAPAREAANAFVNHLEAGSVDAAYGLLCSDTQSRFTSEAFAQGVAGQPKIRSHTIDGVNVVNRNGRTTASVSMSLTLDSGFTDRHAFPLVKEGDAWKVCGQPY